MIDFVVIDEEAYPLQSDSDYALATDAMVAREIEETTVFRACTEDRGDLEGDVLPCEVIQTSLRLTTGVMNVSAFREKLWSTDWSKHGETV